jgi:hypothetical protein
MSAEPVYLRSGDRYISTDLANAGWYEEGQHGGAIAALITGHVEKVPTLTPMEVARVTIELFRVIPLVPLQIETRVSREGKRIQTVQAEVTGPDGVVLASATVHRLRIAERPLPGVAKTPPTTLTAPDASRPVDTRSWGHGDGSKPMFHRNAIEVREIHGTFGEPGSGAIWVRLTSPIVEGEAPTPAQRAVVVADFCNGVSSRLDDSWVFMNSDLTVHIGRLPVSEWVALDADSAYHSLGRGVGWGSLWDESSWVGRSAQTLFLDRV